MVFAETNQQKNGEVNPPDHIEVHHWQEWLQSGVSPRIIAANITSLQNQQPYDHLFYSDELPRRNDGRVVDWVLRRYRHVQEGGWWCDGEDVQQLKQDAAKLRIEETLSSWSTVRSLWGQFKPDKPYLDKDGKAIKYEAPPKTATRITCLSKPANPKLWLEVLANPQVPILIVEGSKKAGALLSLGYVAIALPGIFNGYRQATQQLIEDLAAFACPGRTVYICFDFDAKTKTRHNVNLAIERLGVLFQQAKCQVRVIQLPGPEKGVDDLIVTRGAAAFDALYAAAPSLDLWIHRKYSSLTYAAKLTLCQRYLQEFTIPPQTKLLCLKSRKNTGKTEILSQLAATAIREGIPVLLIGHRVQLVQAICDRIGVPYVTQLRTAETGKLLGYGLCIDSLHPRSQAHFSAEHWRNALVLMDESEQVIWHALSAQTEVGRHRCEILLQLKQLLRNVLTSERGRVVLSDADLSDQSIDFVRGLANSSIEPWIVLNTWKPQRGWNIYTYNQHTPEAWLASLLQQVAAGGRHLICTDSQKPKSKWGTYTLERHLHKLFPHKKILRIDSQTITDPSHAAYGAIAHLNQTLQGYDLVLCSPSLETGVSIDLKGHFCAVWGLFQGVMAENSVRQALARVREGVDRHLWIAAYGRVGRIGNGSTSLKSLLACEHRQVRAHVHLLQDVGLEFLDEDAIDLDRTALFTWGKMACRINAGMTAYREIILAELQAEGHQLIESSRQHSDGEAAGEALALSRDQAWQGYAEAVHTAADCTGHHEYELLKAKTSKPYSDQLKQRKYEIQQRYGQTTPELVKRDDQGWYRQLRLHYFLGIGNGYLKQRDKRVAEAVFYQGKIWIPDLNRSQLGVRIGAYQFLGLNRLLDASRAFRNTDPDLLQLLAVATDQAWEVKAATGVSVHPDEQPIPLLKKFLAPLGLTLKCEGRDRNAEGKPNAGTRYYRLMGLEDGREAIFQFWLQRDQEHSSVTADLLTEAAAAATPVVDPLAVSLNSCRELGSPEVTAGKAIQPGTQVRWRTSLSVWVVKAVEGAIAYIRQLSGWASRIVTAVPISELKVAGNS